MEHTNATQQHTTTRRLKSKLVRRLAAVALGIAATTAVVVPAASPAGAIAGGEFTAKCLKNSMSADFFFYDQMYPGWTAVSTPILFKWDPSRATFVKYSNGWAQYLTGWIGPSTEYFNNLSPGYYQMHYAIQWYYGGQLRSSSMIQATRHLVVYGGYPGYTSNTYKYSDWKSYSFCYEGN